MEKIISICIPSYNMENYLARCLNSLIIPSLSDVEIIVVNDGSKDKTLQIANEYKEKYPDSIVVIDKPNGHYGSTVNAALEIASGKYFRILDADDWFDTEVFEDFVNKIKTIDVDCIHTNYTVHNFNDNTKTPKTFGLEYDKILVLDSYKLPQQEYAMHALTYKLDLLKRIKYKQTEGICYTDTEYVYYPLMQSASLYAMDISLYQYFIGREDQSVSNNAIIKNMPHFLIITEKLVETVPLQATTINTNSIRTPILISLFNLILNPYILRSSYNKDYDKRIRTLLNKLKQFDNQTYNSILSFGPKMLPYVRIWKYFGRISFLLLYPIRILKK